MEICRDTRVFILLRNWRNDLDDGAANGKLSRLFFYGKEIFDRKVIEKFGIRILS